MTGTGWKKVLVIAIALEELPLMGNGCLKIKFPRESDNQFFIRANRRLGCGEKAMEGDSHKGEIYFFDMPAMVYKRMF